MNLTIGDSILKKKDSNAVFVIGILFCIWVAFFKESIFPEKYFNDTITIQRLIEHPYKNLGDSAFTNTARFFRIFHIDKYFLAPILAIVSYFLVIYFSFKKYNVAGISFFTFLLIVSYSAMAMVYISTYSKDLVLFLLVVVPFVFLEKKYLLIWTLFVVLYAYFFRSYWFITILLFWFLKIFVIQKPKFLIFVIPLFYFLISLVYNYVFGTSLLMIRYLANVDRDIDSAQTAIMIYIKGSNFALEALNFIITLIFLIIPIPLILLAKPFYVILALLITIFFYNFIKLYLKQSKNKDYSNIFSFVISFMLVQGLFEPDYGSFVRHLAPMYPIIFICIVKNSKLFQAEETET